MKVKRNDEGNRNLGETSGTLGGGKGRNVNGYYFLSVFPKTNCNIYQKRKKVISLRNLLQSAEKFTNQL